MDRPPRTGTLQTKFFVALLIVGILPGVAALWATYRYSTESLKQAIGNGFQEIARSTAIRIAAAVDTEIDRAVRLALVPTQVRQAIEAANRPDAGATDRAARGRPRTAAYLQEWAGESGYYLRVVLADARGAVVAATGADTPARVTDREWWREAMAAGAGTAYVSSLQFDPEVNDYLFDVAVPVLDERRTTPIGAVGLTIRRQALMDTILPIRIGATGHGMLLDTEGTPLVCPVLPPTSHLIHDALLKELARDRPFWFVADDDAHGGRDSIVGSAPVQFAHRLTGSSLGGERWFAFIRQQPEETYAPIYSLLVTVGLIGFGLVIALASLGFAAGRHIVGPILALRREAETLHGSVSTPPASGPAAGPAADPVDIRTGDEIEDLAHTFRAMRTAIEDNLRTIRTQQEELIRREKLASVGQLLAALAHDLRNPLGVIRSSAQLVVEGRQSGEVQREVARYIMDEVDRLTHRINDFLRYARQKPPEPKPVRAADLVQSALWLWRAQGGIGGIEVDVAAGDASGTLFVDPDQIREALVNLLINAREAMPSGGTLSVGATDNPAGIDLYVADTGCGIPRAHLARIFEPFFTTKAYGTGLGLTNVKRLIEDNGGRLEVASDEGRGTRFTLRFPRHIDEPPAMPPREPSPSRQTQDEAPDLSLLHPS